MCRRHQEKHPAHIVRNQCTEQGVGTKAQRGNGQRDMRYEVGTWMRCRTPRCITWTLIRCQKFTGCQGGCSLCQLGLRIILRLIIKLCKLLLANPDMTNLKRSPVYFGSKDSKNLCKGSWGHFTVNGREMKSVLRIDFVILLHSLVTC
jgi:hypothetical protein